MSETVKKGCGRPVHVHRDGGFLKVACGSRISAVCTYCAGVFRNDWKAIGRDGILNAPEGSVLYFVTLTAPSFGDVHNVPDEAAPPRRCPCGRTHSARADMHLRGVALKADRYDYVGQVAWNYSCGALWSNTVRALRRRMPSAEYFGGWEFQVRGARHLHLILRVHHLDALTEQEILEVVRPATTRDHDGRVLRWGSGLHIKRLTYPHGLPADAFRDNRRARILNYLLKAVGYTVKDTGHDPTWTNPDVNAHFTRLDLAAHKYACKKCQPGVRCASLIHRRWGARSRVVLASRPSRDSVRPGWSPRKLTRKKQAEHRRNYQRLQDLRNLKLYHPHTDPERFKEHLREIRS